MCDVEKAQSCLFFQDDKNGFPENPLFKTKANT
jgi:hypothetical protein